MKTNLSLNKETIAKLNSNEMYAVKGGDISVTCRCLTYDPETDCPGSQCMTIAGLSCLIPCETDVCSVGTGACC